ncbi:MAG: zinc-ribbon domain containing protein [Desulfobacterales bacterium]|nr:zinc-ribbon domain containing protein [Desulfobacterales bacterium]
MKDKILLCIQCEEPFVFSSEDQARFLTLGFASPRRCPECRKKKSKGIEHHEKWEKKDDRKKHALRRNKWHEPYLDE